MSNRNNIGRDTRPRGNTRRRNRKKRVSSAYVMICTLLVIAIILGVMILLNPFGANDAPAMNVVANVTAPALSPVPATYTPVPTEAPTPQPTATPAPTPTEAPVTASELLGFGKVVDPGRSADGAQTAEGVSAAASEDQYLPVYKKAATTEKRIAITVDDCFQVENLRKIISVANKKGGKLTLFPIGENISLPNMAETLQAAVFKLGFEIENHTWSHARVFRLSEEEMAQEIWKQSQALNQALGVTYEQHFFRLMGGDGNNDQRTHRYLRQLGFKGIADWSLSGSDADIDWIKDSLSPGMIYLFHTTDRDTAVLEKFIPYAVEQGYKLVTLNELLGYEDNAITEFATAEMPVPEVYEVDYHTHKTGDYAWIIVKMQDALREQGYLVIDGPSTGYYGKQTAEAVRAFQEANGLPATGEADADTQKRILGVTA